MQKETTHVDNQPALATLLTSYAWFDHVDGPKFAELQRDQFRSIGHWLFLPGAFSSFHKVKNNEEIWIAQSGCVVVHILEPGGTHRTVKVGLNLEGGEQPIVTVPAGYWQAAEIPEGNRTPLERTFVPRRFSIASLRSRNAKICSRSFRSMET
jgi:hypothetical protein